MNNVQQIDRKKIDRKKIDRKKIEVQTRKQLRGMGSLTTRWDTKTAVARRNKYGYCLTLISLKT